MLFEWDIAGCNMHDLGLILNEILDQPSNYATPTKPISPILIRCPKSLIAQQCPRNRRCLLANVSIKYRTWGASFCINVVAILHKTHTHTTHTRSLTQLLTITSRRLVLQLCYCSLVAMQLPRNDTICSLSQRASAFMKLLWKEFLMNICTVRRPALTYRRGIFDLPLSANRNSVRALQRHQRQNFN